MPEAPVIELYRPPTPYAYEPLGQLAVEVANAAEGVASAETTRDVLTGISFVSLVRAVRAYGDGVQNRQGNREFQEFAQNEPGMSDFTARIITREEDSIEGPSGKFVVLDHATGSGNGREQRTAIIPITAADNLRRGQPFDDGFKVTRAEGGRTVAITDPSAGIVVVANLIHVLSTRIEQRANEQEVQAEAARSARGYGRSYSPNPQSLSYAG